MKEQKDIRDRLLACARFGNAPELQEALSSLPLESLDLLITGSDGGKYTMLCEAARYGNLPIVEQLLLLGASVDCKDGDATDPPLKLALENSHIEVFVVLLLYKADIHQPGWMGISTFDRLKEMISNWDVSENDIERVREGSLNMDEKGE